MNVDVDLSFPHHFVCEVLDELPGGPIVQHYFPVDHPAGQDGFVVRVRPESSEAWLGTFASGATGRVSRSFVLSMPNPEKVCVVARGAGYVVAAAQPNVWEKVFAIPIVDARAIPTADLVVFATYTEMLAYGSEGVRWRTKRLAWDGLTILAVSDRTLVGEYWDIREEAMQRFEVDLATGAAHGGVEK